MLKPSHYTKLGLATFVTTSLTLACGAKPESEHSAHHDDGANATAADSDGIVPPQAYYDALYAQTVENLDKGLNLAGSKQVLWVNFNGASVVKGYGRGQSFIPCNGGTTTIPPLRHQCCGPGDDPQQGRCLLHRC